MELREELRRSILENASGEGQDPIDGFYAADEKGSDSGRYDIRAATCCWKGLPAPARPPSPKSWPTAWTSMQIVEGCRYNCDPEHPPRCPDCLAKRTGPRLITIPGNERFIRVQGSPELMPEDLLGDIDPVIAMQCGIHDPRAFTPGRIQRAHRKILFIDELNRIPETDAEYPHPGAGGEDDYPGRVRYRYSGRYRGHCHAEPAGVRRRRPHLRDAGRPLRAHPDRLSHPRPGGSHL